MKKIILSAVAAIFAVAASAQITVTPNFGVGYGKISKFSSDYDEFARYTIGADAQYDLNEKLAVSVGASYAFNQSTKSETITIGSISYKEHALMGTIDVPVLAHYNIISNLSAKAGIMPSFLIKADNGQGSVKKGFKSTQISIPVGVEWKFNSPLVLGVQYNIPLTKMADGADSKYSTVTATLGYRFGL